MSKRPKKPKPALGVIPGRPIETVASNPVVSQRMPAEAFAPNGMIRPRVRIRCSSVPGLYYREGGTTPWVATGYRTWTIEEWIHNFGDHYPDGRLWDFFGDPIDIWPKGVDGYQSE